MEAISRYFSAPPRLPENRHMLLEVPQWNIQNVCVYLYLTFTCVNGRAIQISYLEEASTLADLFQPPGCRRSGELPACHCTENCETEGRCLLAAIYTWVVMSKDKFCTPKRWSNYETWKFGHQLVIFKNTDISMKNYWQVGVKTVGDHTASKDFH